ncbi:16S rRNA (guanine(966)-N(2))-methyltransferase RsmD [Thermosediminibacter oceani]|uniref:Methyltransferase n=1 Tax=Thermosediminibacter oceani (strain ATCC BAA-1034 / DSM 16646 / JW/IW-1228P) TaxID=555079 RepID=D9S325_THEOJ|nr:16S rRNA (guanine(966)-N(2))-methyltransferase RsmD [Thermosediminibacter oceani]ADL07802.1 methyltransferase [Thermosediminibacter oceani DSM 16646]
MRVTGGIFRGRRIKSLPGIKTRPTSDIVRESLFNILGEKTAGSSFLDVFAGTGSVGIEALSRGAERVVFIEEGGLACRIIRENLIKLRISDKSLIIKADYLKGMRSLEKTNTTFDIIFLDPPYDRGFVSPCLEFLNNSELLKPNSIVVVQHSVSEVIKTPPNITCYKEKKYGITKLSFFYRSET